MAEPSDQVENFQKLSMLNYTDAMCNGLNRCILNNTGLDCTLVAERKTINVHRVVLSALSPFFERIFSEQAFIQHSTFFFDTMMSFENLTRMVNYIYVGEVSLPEPEMKKFQQILQRYDLPFVQEQKSTTKPPVKDSFFHYSLDLPILKNLDSSSKQKRKRDKKENHSFFRSADMFKTETEDQQTVQMIAQDVTVPNVSNNNFKTAHKSYADIAKSGTNSSSRHSRSKVGLSTSMIETRYDIAELTSDEEEPPKKQGLETNKKNLGPRNMNLTLDSFKCSYCLKCLANNRNRLNHEAYCKFNPERQIFTCPRCKAQFSTPSLLKRHQNKAHH